MQCNRLHNRLCNRLRNRYGEESACFSSILHGRMRMPARLASSTALVARTASVREKKAIFHLH
jgi:hypothetical protein